MNEELAERYSEVLHELLGRPGRIICYSKTRFRESNPDHVGIYNANICLRAGKITWGDVDLTTEERTLAAVAQRIGETVFVLFEFDGRFEREDSPRLDRAVFEVTPSGHTRFQHSWIERSADGTLRRRPPPPGSRRRIALTIGWPRLWRFWVLERVDRSGQPSGGERTTLLYVGQRGTGKSVRDAPLLVLGYFRAGPPERWVGFEHTWYPARKRYAPRPLLSRQPRFRSGRLRAYARIYIHPGFMYEFGIGLFWSSGHSA